MADIKFSCPRCSQHISCDELWGGHQIQCPSCQGELTVPVVPKAAAPQPVAQQAPAPIPTPSSLVPKPPAAAGPKLSLGAPGHASPTATPPPTKPVPIRNLAPPKEKKANPVVKYAGIAAVLAVLGVGGYFGFNWLMEMQAKSNEASRKEEKNSDGGQVGHIAALNDVLDRTEPGHYGERSERRAAGPKQRPGGARDVAVPGADEDAMKGPGAEKPLPTVPPVWTADLQAAKIPDGRANGMISGTNFLVDTARVEASGTAKVLRLFEGQAASPDREVLIYLHLKPGEQVGGQTLEISADQKGPGVPQVAKRWKTNPRLAPTLKSYNTGYVMKLELGQMTNNALPGKIFLAFPDPEQSVVAGIFKVTTPAFDLDMPTPAAAAAPAARPGMTPVPAGMSAADRAAYEKRYGTRR
jgi:hypothetical protein